MLKRLTAYDRLNTLADAVERFPRFDMTSAAHCYYGVACRLFGESLEHEPSDHIPHLASMLGVSQGHAAHLYHSYEFGNDRHRAADRLREVASIYS